MHGQVGWRDQIGTYRDMVDLLFSHRRRSYVGEFKLGSVGGSVATVYTRSGTKEIGGSAHLRAVEARGGVIGASSRPGTIEDEWAASAAPNARAYVRLITTGPPGTERRPRRGVMVTPTERSVRRAKGKMGG